MNSSLITKTCLLCANLALIAFGTGTAAAQPARQIPQERSSAAANTDNTRIQVAILLDTSNSMDGLIDQAKARLWSIVNTLTTLKYQGKAPVLEIALYEYGNDGLSAANNYMRMVSPLTSDLDFISEKLFSLHTNGGSEYCGAVIRDAVRRLEWGKRPADMKLVYIAGNEPFNQGSISYRESASDAAEKNIFVNTIFCGNYEDGARTFWKDGAARGKGRYFNIDPDRKVRFVETPYDERIEAANRRLNDTYIGYGRQGEAKKQSQAVQDQNALSVSKANYAERAVSKSKARYYNNSSWDLVDKVKDDEAALSNMSKEELPAAYKEMSRAEIASAVAQKAKERAAIQQEIADLAKKRQVYIDVAERKEKAEDDLGDAITESIMTLAKQKGYMKSE